MGEYTTLEIASLCQKTERTVQRWLSTGKLKATYLLGNRYEVAENDLQPFLPHHEVESLSERLSTLEARQHDVEQRLTALEARLHPAPRTPRATPTAHSEGEALPDGYSALTSWCELHNVGETTARTYSSPDDFRKGKWYDHNGGLVKVAIDQRTQHHLWGIFHNKTKFKPCADCPHTQ